MGFLDRFIKARKKPELEKIKPQIKVEKDVKIKEEKKEEIKKAKKNLTRGNAHRILSRPLVSEKATAAEANRVYTFVVNPRATKGAVKQAIKEVYGVEPIKVRVVNMEGKKARHGRSIGRRKDWRKAMVTLPAGRAISVHEGV
ncbi:MAG: 50S ribosomal protein L23 [Candidatus Magasanikbacteria bacterium]|nr:50S ribosomal protein L23 [Candidatus Magasanikbacteria bacterium]